jgi:hypothetical protein
MEFKLPAMPKDTKPFCLGALAGAVLITWAGFDALGWKTGGASETLAKRQADGAVVAGYAHICAAQFNGAKDLPVRLAALQKSEQWSRGDVVAKGGFATMAGEKEPTQGVSQACADLLIPAKS